MSAESPENHSSPVSPPLEETAPVAVASVTGEVAQSATTTCPEESVTETEPSPSPQPNGGSNRVYINNVSYHTTESDLYDFVKDFNVVSVLIPSHTIRGFKSLKQKSLGIAYVDFSSPEEAERAKVALNGKKLDHRVLRVKPFIPYIPNRVIVKADAKQANESTSAELNSSVRSPAVESTVQQDFKDGVSESSGAESFEKSESEQEPSANTESSIFSTDTIFIDRLSPKTTDADLRAYFANYAPTEVYIFKCRYLLGKKSKSFFRHRQYVSALITLGADDGLSKALTELKGTRLKGHHIFLKASYLSKIEEVKKAAQAQHIPVQKVGVKDVPCSSAAPSTTSASSVEACVTSSVPCCETDDCECPETGALSPDAHGCVGCATVDDELVVTGIPVEPVN